MLLMGITGEQCYFIIQKVFGVKALNAASNQSENLVNEAKSEAQRVLSKAHADSQDIMSKSRLNIEEEIKTRRQAIGDIEDRVLKKERMINEKDNKLNERDSLNQELERIKRSRKRRGIDIRVVR